MTGQTGTGRPAPAGARGTAGAEGTAGTWVTAAAWAIIILVSLPLIVVILTSFNPGNDLTFPPKGFSLRWYANILARPAFLESFRFSLLLAGMAVAVSLVVGTLASLAIVRHRFPGRDWLNTYLLSPLMVPEVVLGMVFLMLLHGMGIVRSAVGYTVVHVTLTLPYTVRALVASLTRFPVSLEEAAMTLGASPARAFALITLPVIRPGLVTATVFAFVVSFQNFTASQFLVWDRSTLPIEIYAYITTENNPTVTAISTVLIVMTGALVLALERWVGLDEISGASSRGH